MAILRMGTQREYQEHLQATPTPRLMDVGPAIGAGSVAPVNTMLKGIADSLGGVAKMGEVFANAYRANETARVEDELLKADRKFTEWKAEYEKNNQGVAAIDAAKAFRNKHQEIMEEARANFNGKSNEIFERLLNRRLEERDIQYMKEGIAYGVRQEKAWQESQWAGQVAEFERFCQENPEDYEGIKERHAELIGSFTLKNPGLDPSAMSLKLGAQADEARVETMIAQGNLQGARRALSEGVNRDPQLYKGGTIAEDLCNPLNLKKVGATGSSRSAFQVFASDADGFRGAWRQLKIYQNGDRHLQKPAEMIKVWAPPEDGNDYESYIKVTEAHGKIDTKKPININDPHEAAKLLKGMATKEGPLGAKYTTAQIESFLRENNGIARTVNLGSPHGMEPLKAARYLKRIEELEARAQVAKASGVNKILQDYFAASERGHIVDKPFTEAELIAQYGEEKGAELASKMNMAGKFALAVTEMQKVSPAQQAEIIRNYEAIPGEEGYKEAVEFQESLLKYQAQDLKRREADPVQYVYDQDENLQKAQALFFSNPNKETFDNYIKERDISMELRGLQGGIFTQKARQAVGAIIEQSPNKGEILKLFQESCGDLYPDLLHELSPTLSSKTIFISSRIPEHAATMLWEATKDKDYKKNAYAALGLKGPEKTSFEESIREKLAPIMATFARQGAEDMALTIEDQVQTYALQLQNMRGYDQSKAIETAYEELIGKQYDLAKSPGDGSKFRVPVEYNAARVETGAEELIREINVDNVHIKIEGSASRRVQKGALKTYLNNNASLVSTEDESGCYIYLGHQRLEDKKGNPVILSYSDMQTRGQQAYDAAQIKQEHRINTQGAGWIEGDLATGEEQEVQENIAKQEVTQENRDRTPPLMRRTQAKINAGESPKPEPAKEPEPKPQFIPVIDDSKPGVWTVNEFGQNQKVQVTFGGQGQGDKSDDDWAREIKGRITFGQKPDQLKR